MKYLLRIAFLVLAASMAAAASAQSARQIAITDPKDGATLASPFTVRLDAKGVKVAPAGDVQPGVGHHHLLVNGEPLSKGEEIPFTRRHLHLNQGQTDVQVNLQPGTYKLTAQFGDGAHKSLGPEFSHTITVTVK
jgi:hypothetical protein